MAFHIEISRSIRRAWAFNLDADELRTSVLEPWIQDRRIELGGREWQPSRCTLKVLEGPKLEAPDLAVGQGWSNAARHAVDVTERALAAATPSVVLVVGAGEDDLEALDAAGFAATDFTTVRAEIFEGRINLRVGAVAIWLSGLAAAGIEAGAAAAALPAKTLLVTTSGALVPPALAGLPVVESGDELVTALRSLI